MKVWFSGKHAVNPDTFGINFEAHLDGHRISCRVSREALQDIDPDNRMDAPVDQFLANLAKFQELAERKIRASLPTTIDISSADVCP